MARIKKQIRLTKKFHTCTCTEHEYVIDWNSTELIDINFELPELFIPEGRTIWMISTCKTCRQKIIHGRGLCDPRITGKRLLIEAMRVGMKNLPLRQHTTLASKIKTLWEEYNGTLYHDEIRACLDFRF